MRVRQRGFSFVELLVVMAILVVIAAIAIPSFLSSIQRAREAGAIGFLRQLATAQETYRIANHEYADTFAKLVPYMNTSIVPPEIPGETPSGVLFAFTLLPQGGQSQGGTSFGQSDPPSAPTAPPASDSKISAMYVFYLSRPQPLHWQCIAEPLRDRTLNKFFLLDNTNVIRYAVGALPNATSPQL